MPKQVHILNGDALLEQFPEDLSGERIVLRECLVDGNVKGENLKELYEVRAGFLGISEEEYENHTVSEFKKIEAIPNDFEINLWFEDDLFYQVNFWFAAHLLSESENRSPVFLVRPKVHTQYGFGAYSSDELEELYNNRQEIIHLKDFQTLWKHYQENSIEELTKLSKELSFDFPFLADAVKAHIERIPDETSEGRPKESIRKIIKELDSVEFGPVFREFCKRESIYGFGDLQVKRMFDEILASET
ncbi:MAG: DUF1835 domain-containing protein [Balneola sp.]